MLDMVSVGWQWASKTPRCQGNGSVSFFDAIVVNCWARIERDVLWEEIMWIEDWVDWC
jgi:hypothetical protein